MKVIGSIEFKLKEIVHKHDFNSGYTNLFPVIVSHLSENDAKNIIMLDTKLSETLKTTIGKDMVRYLKDNREVFNMMIKEMMDSSAVSQENAIERLLDWELWSDYIDFDVVEFIQES